jgi:hypothetical protein
VFAAASVAGPCYRIERSSHQNLAELIACLEPSSYKKWIEIGMHDNNFPEPWLRGTLPEVPAVPRAVLHGLQLAREDLERWCGQSQ